MTVMVK